MVEDIRIPPARLPLFAARPQDRPAARALAGTTRPPPPAAGPPTTSERPAGLNSVAQHPSATRPGDPGHPTGLPPLLVSTPLPSTPSTEAVSSVGVDWATVTELRAEVSERIRGILDPGATLDVDQHGPPARDLITEAVRSYHLRQISLGRPPLSLDEQAGLGKAVFDAIFGLGRIQALLDQPGLENIEIRGHDTVVCLFADGRVEYVDPVADNNEQLIRELQLLAAHARGGERAFSAANPMLDLTLPDGSRLSATAWVAPGPLVTIRRHGLVDIDIYDLVDLNSIDEVAAGFLDAAMQAGRSACVSGLPASGKTTFARALLNCLHPDTSIATIETEYELHLHRLPHRHRRVWPVEARPGGGERDSRGDVIGEVTLTDLLRHCLRQNVDRIVVGEVRGREVLPMLEAMTAGKGSLSTIHATGVQETIERIVTCALQAGNHVTTDYAYRQVGTHINLIVHLGVLDQTARGGRKHRFVRSISAVTLGEQHGTGIATTTLYQPGPDGRATPTGLVPDWINELAEYGFDPHLLTERACAYQAPLDVLPPAPLRPGRPKRVSA